MEMYEVHYKYKGQTSDKVYSIRVPCFGNDIEYEWRMSPLNKPHTIFIKAERVSKSEEE